MIGTIPDLPPTMASESMEQWNSEPMIERPVNLSPVFIAPLRVQDGHTRGAAGTRGRSVDLARADGDGVGAGQDAVLALDGRRELAERDAIPSAVFRMHEPQLLVGRLRDFDAERGIAAVGRAAASANELLSAAEAACHAAKQRGGNRMSRGNTG
jgi:hypothetical protein